MTPVIRRVGAVLASAALVVIAAAATVSAPTDDQVQEPIEVRGDVGTTVTSRTAAVTVHDVRLAHRLDLGEDGPDTTTAGVWVAIDLTATCRLTSCSFDDSRLRMAGHTYAPAVLAPSPSFVLLNGEPGLDYRVTALFEVPSAAVRSRDADLIAQTTDTTALDSVAVVSLRLPAAVEAVAAVGTARIVGAAR